MTKHISSMEFSNVAGFQCNLLKKVKFLPLTIACSSQSFAISAVAISYQLPDGIDDGIDGSFKCLEMDYADPCQIDPASMKPSSRKHEKH